MRHAKIVATLGPASDSPEVIKRMIRAGMDVARLNASHGTLDEHVTTVARVRAAAAAERRHIAVLFDLAGAKLRTGPTSDGRPVRVAGRAPVRLRAGVGVGTASVVFVDYPDLLDDVKAGDRVLLADGALELAVEARESDALRCKVIAGGDLGPNKGVAFPDSQITLPAMTTEDEEAIDAGVRAGVDYFGLSFAGSAEHVRQVKNRIGAAGEVIPVIAKIERRQAIDNLDAILAEADGAMVARGDLGVELPLERVPIEQRRIIEACRRHLRPVITATQMLESMVSSPRPTRAEASDVENSIWDLSDALMLSDETAIGDYPVEAVAMMDRLIRAAEEVRSQEPPAMPALEGDNHAYVIASAARRVVESDRNIRAVVCFSQSGMTALLMSKVHPPATVYAISPLESTCRRLSLARGVVPMLAPWVDSSEAMLRTVDQVLLGEADFHLGDECVVVASLPLRVRGVTNFLKLHRLGESGAWD